MAEFHESFKGTYKPLTAERVRELLNYAPETGVFTWRVNRGGTANSGSVAGHIDQDGYGRICVDGPHYVASRLAWLYMTGNEPPNTVDHRDLNKVNNRWSNLRAATVLQNMRNRSKYRNNTSGFKGVCRHKPGGKFKAQISVNGRRVHLGCFDTAEAAYAVYCEAAKKLHGEFARVA